jgi:hypothetical protein
MIKNKDRIAPSVLYTTVKREQGEKPAERVKILYDGDMATAMCGNRKSNFLFVRRSGEEIS